jgi:hypothetical protein
VAEFFMNSVLTIFDLWRFLLDTEVVYVEAKDGPDSLDDSIATVTARTLSGVMVSSVFLFEWPVVG